MTQQERAGVSTSASGDRQRSLEQHVPLSQSLIWRWQRDFYVRRALKAWTEDLVPSYITNNPFIAELYAGMIAGFVRDCMASESHPISGESRLRILELGSGTGKFCFLLLRKLIAALQMRNIPANIFRYAMMECSESVLAEWRANPYLAEFVREGLLQFGVFEAGQNGQPISLEGDVAEMVIEPKSPLVVIANYVFDSLPADAFAIDHGRVGELLVTTSAQGHTAALGDLRFSYDKASISSQRYAEPLWNNILEQYRREVPTATILFPTSALESLKQLSLFSDGRMLVLAADKGLAHEEDLPLLQGEPTLEFHASKKCFSQPVNFDAIAKYFRAIGGGAILPQKHFTSLNLCAFLQHDGSDRFPATHQACQQLEDAFGPDDVFAIMSWLNAHLEEVPLTQAIALLRLTRWDPTALARLFPIIVRQLRNVTAERNDMRDAVLKTWENHYPLTKEDNVLAFYSGVILLELRFFSEACTMFRISQQLLGPSATTSYNLGLCSLGRDQPAEALEFMREACQLDPHFEPARQSCAQLEKQFRTGQ